ncbi:PepSY domain-containing protein [Jeotgalibacillus soli]|uniref:PepSY domain-containing protein n=1 Tax=Jeotgalibacillus soli TaxID=889306 RepID=A0A0C2VQP7_9BACL|nr:PepSY domain-containing protein [Jeotgalibacillus soli]KIL46776.1 hypothetical protein KP78_18940 [Jeotgalibacillus soli]
MKRKMITGTLVSAVILGGAIGAGAMTNGFESVSLQSKSEVASITSQTVGETQKEMLSIEEAKEIAVAKYGGYVESIELERENRVQVYDIDIENDGIEYDIDLDAYTGEFLKVKEERDDDDDDKQTGENALTDDVITQDEAISIALKAAPGTVVRVELDEDDGRIKYEIEIKTTDGEADIEIDAHTGDILEVDHDRD